MLPGRPCLTPLPAGLASYGKRAATTRRVPRSRRTFLLAGLEQVQGAPRPRLRGRGALVEPLEQAAASKPVPAAPAAVLLTPSPKEPAPAWAAAVLPPP